MDTYKELEIELKDLECIGEWEAFELYRYEEDELLFIYKPSIEYVHKAISKEVMFLKLLESVNLAFNVVTCITLDNRYGFIVKAGQVSLLAISIRENPSELLKYAKILGSLHVQVHDGDYGGRKARIILDYRAYIMKSLENLTELPEFQFRLIDLLKSIQYEEVLCHNDLGPYHVLLEDNHPRIIDWVNASYGDPMADIAKSIFWMCSDYVPGIGPYLIGKDVKKRFITAYLSTYQSFLSLKQDQILSWLVIFAAIEYDTEVKDEGLSPDLELLYNFIKAYFNGDNVNYFDYLIYEN